MKVLAFNNAEYKLYSFIIPIIVLVFVILILLTGYYVTRPKKVKDKLKRVTTDLFIPGTIAATIDATQ
jgi:uncharacterized membrane protein (DUF485 family)